MNIGPKADLSKQTTFVKENFFTNYYESCSVCYVTVYCGFSVKSVFSQIY